MSSPIVIDLSGKGFHFSDASQGVLFRPYPNRGEKFLVAWPLEGVRNGWLALDRNGNGTIDDFGELFGDKTTQPAPPPGKHRNGFAALSVYDLPENGGNGDDIISSADAIFSKLRVWVDLNHNGFSEPGELLTLEQAGVASIDLRYHLDRKVDQNGNVFRYRSSIADSQGSTDNKTIYDVFVGVQNPNSTSQSRVASLKPKQRKYSLEENLSQLEIAKSTSQLPRDHPSN